MSWDLELLKKRTGLEDVRHVNHTTLFDDFMPAAVTGLAGGDLLADHPVYDGEMAELYGEQYYDDGRVAQNIGRAALELSDDTFDENGNFRRGVMSVFQELAAEYFYSPDSAFRYHGSRGAVNIYPDALKIDGHYIPLARRPRSVIELSACINSRSILSDQVGFIDNGEDGAPFTYMGFTRNRFAYEVLKMSYDYIRVRDVMPNRYRAHMMRQSAFFAGGAGPMVNAIDFIDCAIAEDKMRIESSDVVVATGAAHTTAGDMYYGVSRAYNMLREDGRLIVRGLAFPAADEVGTDQMADWAHESGFDPKRTLLFSPTLAKSVALMTRGRNDNRSVKSAIFHKW